MNLQASLHTLLLLLVSAVVVNAAPAPYDLTRKQIADFRRDGVIVVRGLLQGDALKDAVEAAQKIQNSQGWAQRLVHKIFPAYDNLDFQVYRKYKAFQRVAFDSSAPTICAKLMGLDKEGSNPQSPPRSLRLLKEAILGFSRGDMGCGWHVDDKTFWPCEDSHQDSQNSGRRDRRKRMDAGINVWITLSPLSSDEGGGLAVAPRSHNLSGRGGAGKILRRARMAIVSKGRHTQCILDKVDPSCSDFMERCKRVYDLQPGDAIIHDRYIFHKSERFNEEHISKNDSVETKQRISIRYMPSDATFFNNGKGFDGAANEKNLKTGDPLWKGGEYFPQVWPSQLEEEMKTSPKEDVNPFGTRFLMSVIKQMLGIKLG